nr:hypothetical protein AOJQRVMU_AOJQRVMU_CDS_0014 [Microvirus sp.]
MFPTLLVLLNISTLWNLAPLSHCPVVVGISPRYLVADAKVVVLIVLVNGPSVCCWNWRI